MKRFNINDANIYKIIDAVEQSIYWKDLNGKYLGCNKYMLGMVGLKSRNEVIGRTDYDLPWENVASELHQHDQLAIKNGSHAFEESYINQAGQKKTYLTNKSQLLDEDGHIIGIIGTSLDITDRIQKERLERENQVYQAKQTEQKKLENLVEEMHQLMQGYRSADLDAKLNKKPKPKAKYETAKIKLTKRQTEVLHYLSRGLSPKEIAEIIRLVEKKETYSPATVQSIIDQQLYKLFDVNNLGALLKRAGELRKIPFLLTHDDAGDN